jgi:hypothetical protein
MKFCASLLITSAQDGSVVIVLRFSTLLRVLWKNGCLTLSGADLVQARILFRPPSS